MLEEETLNRSLAAAYVVVVNKIRKTNRNQPHWVTLFDLSLFILSRKDGAKRKLVDVVTDDFKEEYLWEFLIALRNCPCCLEKYENDAECLCYYLESVIILALKKKAYRKAKSLINE